MRTRRFVEEMPLSSHHLLLEKKVQSGVERPFLDREQIVGGSLDVLRKSVTVEGLSLQRSKNHPLQHAGKEVSVPVFL